MSKQFKIVEHGVRVDPKADSVCAMEYTEPDALQRCRRAGRGPPAMAVCSEAFDERIAAVGDLTL